MVLVNDITNQLPEGRTVTVARLSGIHTPVLPERITGFRFPDAKLTIIFNSSNNIFGIHICLQLNHSLSAFEL